MSNMSVDPFHTSPRACLSFSRNVLAFVFDLVASSWLCDLRESFRRINTTESSWATAAAHSSRALWKKRSMSSGTCTQNTSRTSHAGSLEAWCARCVRTSRWAAISVSRACSSRRSAICRVHEKEYYWTCRNNRPHREEGDVARSESVSFEKPSVWRRRSPDDRERTILLHCFHRSNS